MNNIIDWIQKVSLDRYSVKESSDYDQYWYIIIVKSKIIEKRLTKYKNK